MPWPPLALLRPPMVGNGMSLNTAWLAAHSEESGPMACLACAGVGAASPVPGGQMSTQMVVLWEGVKGTDRLLTSGCCAPILIL